LVAFAAVANAAPQLLLDSSSSLGIEDEAPFNDNPQYTYSYQVAADDEQTYIAHTESRDGADVTGEYSYVDPLGNLIKVTYTAGAMGYTETREVVPNFVQIRSRPVNPEPAPAPVRQVVQQVRPAVQQVQQVTTSSSSNDGDLVANIIAQLTPFIRTTVSNSLGGSGSSSSGSSSATSQTTTTTTSSQRQPVSVGTTRRVVSRRPVPEVRRVVESVPVVTETSSSAVSNIFGSGGPNNVRFESPDSSFAFDLN